MFVLLFVDLYYVDEGGFHFYNKTSDNTIVCLFFIAVKSDYIVKKQLHSSDQSHGSHLVIL